MEIKDWMFSNKITVAANVSSYSHYIFSAIAQEDAEVITFEVFQI